MKHSFSILAAAAAAVTALLRGMIDSYVFDPGDGSQYIPPLTAEEVRKLASSNATDQEMAEYFLVDAELIHQRFGRLIKSQRAMYRIALRSLQIQSAKKLAPSVLIFLGKNDLGQSNNPAKPGEPEPQFEADDL